MHPSLKELAAKVAEARKKEHKPRFSPNGTRLESFCNSLESQIKQRQEPGIIIFYGLHHFFNSCTVSGRGRFTGHFLF